MTPCPTCNKPVDTLRARAVGVRDGKVVAYCSQECLAKAQPSKAPVAHAQTARGTAIPTGIPRSIRDLDSGPVIEIIHEPASGVVTSARDERKAKGRSNDDDEIDARAGSKDATGARTSEGRDLSELSGELGSQGKDKLVIAATKPQRGGKTKRSKQDSIDSRAGWDWIEDEPAENVRAGTDGIPHARVGAGRGIAIFLVLLVAIGGGAVAYYKLWHVPKKAQRHKAAAHAPVMPAPADAMLVVEVPPNPGIALERAREVLRTHLKSGSLRVQRLAAAALARTGDVNAIAILAHALATERVVSVRLELAYQLARANDKRGHDALAAALTLPRRDDKHDAARYLAQLGDARAVPVLVMSLEMAQHRLSAAEQLAHFADARGIKVLEQIRTDEKSSADHKARATIGLGIARAANPAMIPEKEGNQVSEELRAMLDDDRNNTFAAGALAVLRDEAARPVLIKHLDVPSLRVNAARALRKLDPDRDLGALAPTKALESEKDIDQIQAAEAIVLLLGPSSLSERA